MQWIANPSTLEGRTGSNPVPSAKLTGANTMQSLQQLIKTLFDESGVSPSIEITFTKNGWLASLVSDDMTLLCPAGEFFLSSGGHDTPDSALAALDRIAKDGYSLINNS